MTNKLWQILVFKQMFSHFHKYAVTGINCDSSQFEFYSTYSVIATVSLLELTC